MSDTFFRIEMLPANQGDALWIEYGTKDDTRRILIDGGPIGAYSALDERLKELPDGDKGVDLVVITHVDTDHIEGIIRLFADERGNWPLMPKDIWFNGWEHLENPETLGGMEGDFMSALISERAPDEWNKAFDKKAVVVKPGKKLPVKTLKGGMKLTLLAPTPQKLKDMADKWTEDVKKHKLDPGDLKAAWKQLVEMKKYKVVKGVLGGMDDFTTQLAKQLKTDQSLANGTSIAFLAEFNGKSCLFLADAHADVICDSIKKLIPAGQKQLKVDAVKVSHHGSKHNISLDLMNLIDAKHFLISTNGSIHKHPDKSAIEALIRCSSRKPTLWFNYLSKYNAAWKTTSNKKKSEFSSNYPESREGGIVIKL